MKIRSRIWFKLLFFPFYSLRFIRSLILTLTLSLFNATLDWFLLLASNLVRVLMAGFEFLLVLNFRLSNLSPCMISPDLDDDDDEDDTVMQFWVPTKLNPNKPNLILIHGFGGSSRWQFCCQIWHLSRKVNLFMPDLLFFGNSYSGRSNRSEALQARCVAEGMKKLGVKSFSVAGISYGGYVSYKIGELYPKEVEKVVIMSSAICYTEEQKMEHLNKIGRSPLEVFVPEKPQDLRCLLNLCLYRLNWIQRLPDFILQAAIQVVLKGNEKEKWEILEYLLNREADSDPGTLTQETLIIWGDKDRVFPIKHAYQLQRRLEAKAKVQVIENAGHALNLDSPFALNHFIISFLLS